MEAQIERPEVTRNRVEFTNGATILPLVSPDNTASVHKDDALSVPGSGELPLPPDFFQAARDAIHAANKLSKTPLELRESRRQAGAIEGLDITILSADRAIETCDPTDQDLHSLLHVLLIQGSTLQTRFKLSEDIADLDRSTSMFESAPHFCGPKNHPGLHPGDLNRLIDHWESASFQAWSPSPEEKAPVAIALARLLEERFETMGNVEDGCRVTQLCEGALPFVAKDERLGCLKPWLNTLLRLSMSGVKVSDLDKTLALLQQVYDLASSSDKEDVSISIGLFLRFQLRNAVTTADGEMADSVEKERHKHPDFADITYLSVLGKHPGVYLDSTIEALRRRCHEQGPDGGQAIRPFSSLDLVVALLARHRHSRRPDDLREALDVRSSDLLSPLGTYCTDVVLLRYAAEDLDPSGMEQKLDDAVNIHSSQGHAGCPAARAFSPESNGRGRPIGFVGAVVNLGSSTPQQSMLTVHYMPTSKLRLRAPGLDLDPIQQELLLSLSSPDKSEGRLESLCSLADLHYHRYEQHNKPEDLIQVVHYLWQLVSSLDDDDESRRAWLWKTNWAQMVCALHDIDSSHHIPHSQLLLSHDYLRASATDPNHYLLTFRLIFVQLWFGQLLTLWRARKSHSLEMCTLTLQLLEQQSWAASNIRFSIDNRYQMHDLLTNAVVLSWLADCDNMKRAIEVLEAGRSLVWTQLHVLRSPLQDLTMVDPKLADRFKKISQTLANRIVGLPLQTDTDPFQTQMDSWRIQEDRKQILKEIQSLPGFEGFLKPKSWRELQSIAERGPVVVLTHGSTWSEAPCLAFIFLSDRLTSQTLPISFTELRTLHDTLDQAGTRGHYDGHVETNSTLASSSTTPLPDGSESQESRPFKKRLNVPINRMDGVLETLWRQVAMPIVEKIVGRTSIDGESKLIIPNREDRMRIWWCCTGEFSFMPIHAAGVYHGASPVCVSDLFVSSYTPTLTALLEARNRPIPTELKVLAAVQPDPGMGWMKLPNVKLELQEIIQAVPPENLLYLGGSNGPDYEGTQTTVSNVVAQLSEVTILHLACHGVQEPTNPLRSGFVLARGERLTVEELMKHRLANAHTAILSACHTGSNDRKQPDESINLASAMLSLGFSSILATKWPMYDDDGPSITRAVYSAFMNGHQQTWTILFVARLLGECYTPLLARSLRESDVQTIGNAIKPILNNDDPLTLTTVKAMITAGFASVSSEKMSDSELKIIGCVLADAMQDGSAWTLPTLSLAHIIDEFARELRVVQKVPASRWATFIHVGA